MSRKSAALALVPLLLVAALVFGQAPSTPRPVRQPGVAPLQVHTDAGDAAARDATPVRPAADARECLEYLTNIGVIRCAERYRHRDARPAR
ncbi:MAG TPA: hypothetical protein VLN42_02560 [Casimicrobiaceae bacterium]|nr:hypothetical protein [Casimicrobiaceae bacterium]